MGAPTAPLTLLSGRFYRILFQCDLPRLLAGVITEEGRFHHDGERALYMSPSPEDAAHAIAPYLRAGDGPRVVAPLRLVAARVADLRSHTTRVTLGLQGHETGVPWLPERAAGRRATTWTASDAARAAGADGMIYPARSTPERWHLVLFRWNIPGAPTLAEDGPSLPFTPRG